MTLFTKNNLDANGVDRSEAPEGFYATLKEYNGYNICRDCDARKLCQENKDNWCQKNRCMDYELVGDAANGYKYNRKDGKSVIFKQLPTPNL